MRAETLHMTLQFIGNVQHSRLPTMIAAAENVTSASFSMQLKKVAYWKHNQIAYATLSDDEPSLTNLARSLKTALNKAGMTHTDQKFSPHVTLLRNAQQEPQIHDFTGIEWPVNAFVLVESTLNNRGPHYNIIKTWKLSDNK